MSATATTEDPGSPAFELKGTSYVLPVLRVLRADVDEVARGLAEKVAEAPQLLHNAPLVIDLQALKGQGTSVDFALLVGLLRSSGLIPVGVSGGSEAQNEIALAMDLAVLSRGTPRQAPAAKRVAEAPRPGVGKVVTQPVRSGQRVYAAGGDLVVLGAVGSGAEVFADGNVHVYGPLRGRALAGVKGAQSARIFCQGLEAELVAVAGIYRVSEDIEGPLRGRPAQVYLDGRRLRVAAI